MPGVILGALVSTRAPAGLIRRALAVVLLASGLKLLGVSTPVTVAVLVGCVLLGPPAWMLARRYHGLPALRRSARSPSPTTTTTTPPKDVDMTSSPR